MTAAGRVALVTGASSGIGKASAAALVGAGFQVVGTSRDARRAPVMDGVTFIDLDVASDDSVKAAVDLVLDRFGRLDVLVNNAGIGSAGAAEEVSIAMDQRVFDVNVFGVLRMMKAVLPQMRSQTSGRIINVSSVLGFVPQPHMAAYVATKHAIEGYSESVDHEVRHHGVRVLLVEPANTNTTFDVSLLQADVRLPEYSMQRRDFDELMAISIKDGDDPATVAKAVVAAATERKPKLRYPAGPTAGRVTKLRRIVPTGVFDKQIRKTNRMAS